MATLQEVLDYADTLKPNKFSTAMKAMWLNEVEGMVQTEVFCWAPEEIVSYDPETDGAVELLVQPPHDKIYRSYLVAMIDFANGEYNRYQTTKEFFDEQFGQFQRWFADTYRPADSHGEVYE